MALIFHNLAAASLFASLVQLPPRERCEFDVVDASTLSADRFRALALTAQRPLLIVGTAVREWPAWKAWASWDALAEEFSGARFRVGAGPYPARNETLRSFARRAAAYDALPMNVFQFGQVPTLFTLHGEARMAKCGRGIVAIPIPYSEPLHADARVACALLARLRVPPWLRPAQISHAALLLGTFRSGIDFHEHKDAVNALLRGEKWWAIRPPGLASYSAAAAAGASGTAARRARLRNALPTATRDGGPEGGSDGFDDVGRAVRAALDDDSGAEAEAAPALLCVQRAGEIVYIPQDAQHSAIVASQRATAVQFQWESGHWDSDGIRGMLESILASKEQHAQEKAEL